ncbi:MAG: aldo/keto reductase [Actinomycetota bacterium]|nr:aldo/keto reductase [Actinomycetota bacterium]
MVSELCVGTSGWGNLRQGENDIAHRARIAALTDRGLGADPRINYLDASNIYGGGRSEELIGEALARTNGVPEGYVVQTKLDRNVVDDDFSAAQMWRSIEQSLERLGLSSVQIMFLHDPEVVGFDVASAPGGPLDALVEMKRQGLVAHIGISGGPVQMLQQFVETDQFDMIITHNRFTLVDRSAQELLVSAKRRGMGVNNAAPYGGGALSGRPGAAERYGYRPTGPEVRRSIDEMTRVCSEAGVPISAAALQFSLRSPLVDSTVIGVSSVDRLDAALADADIEIPDGLWSELESLAPPASAALDAPSSH